MKSPTAIFVLRAQQVRKTNIFHKRGRHGVLEVSGTSGPRQRVPIGARNPALRDSLGTWKFFFHVRDEIVFFVLADFKLINEAVQISARHTQTAGALHLVPAILAQSAQNEPALKLADLGFIRSVDA